MEARRYLRPISKVNIARYVHSSHAFGLLPGSLLLLLEHFKRLKKQFPDIDYKDMIFFDNEYHNIVSVEKLGVHGIYCPQGLTREVWEGALAKYSQGSRVWSDFS